MTVKELAEATGFTPLALPSPEHTVAGGYVGDLLSWVMGNASPDCAWVTIMTNRNIIAVASLIDMGCIILAEGCSLPEDVTALAQEQGINVLASPLPTYETCGILFKYL